MNISAEEGNEFIDNVSEEELSGLFEALQSVFKNPFEAAIRASIARGNTYCEVNQTLAF